MIIIPPSPEDYRETKLFKLLLEKSLPDDGLAEKAIQIIGICKPLQELIISGPFKDYTLHNPNHSKKLLHLVEFVLEKTTLENLSTLELFTIICCCYIHDIGMSLTSAERVRIIESQDFLEIIKNNDSLNKRFEDSRQLLIKLDESEIAERLKIETELFQLQEIALTYFLRPRHATKERYEQVLESVKSASGRQDLLKLNDVTFETELIDICVSHNLPIDALIANDGLYKQKYPYDLTIANQVLNTQFCAGILRLVDILDFDRERTPKILFEALGIGGKKLPGYEITIKEWNKHLSVNTIKLEADEVLIVADSHHPSIEKSIKDFCEIIEREVRDTYAIIKQNPDVITEKSSFHYLYQFDRL